LYFYEDEEIEYICNANEDKLKQLNSMSNSNNRNKKCDCEK